MPFHRVQLGDFELIAIQSMPTSLIPAKDLFPNAEVSELEHEYALDPRYFGPSPAELRFTQNVTVIRRGQHVVLVDTGIPVDQENALLLSGLAEAGIQPKDVTHVILTHRDMDHVGGSVRDGEPTFPNARYIMGRTEAETYRVDPVRNHFPTYVGPVEALGQFDVVDDNAEVLPGIRLVFTPGHRPGATSVLIGDRALLLADVWHSHLQTAHPDWSIKFDTDPDLAAQTRKDVVAMVEERSLIAAVPHTPDFGLGRIVGSRWQPLI